ncbi:MAG TPA: gamma-glutamyltransferase family protein, partial [Thermomicrobiales bacterium]|nr:gamma-glutamyltransferase family protein [Thermomicrobiales bacterium]
MTTTASPPATHAWTGTTPPAEATWATRGVVATAHQYASLAGLEALRAGGNAVDAAISAGAVLMTVKPWSGHLGGDVFMLIHHPGEEVVAINGSGAAPAAATAAHYRALGGIPPHGLLAASVPGAVRAWQTALERFGSLPLADLLQPAIEHAERGVPVSPAIQRGLDFGARMAHAEVYPDSASVFLPGGAAPPVGSLFRQPGLARTLRRIAQHGPDDFYSGDLAREMARYMAAHGGQMTAADLASHQSEVTAPIAVEYRDHTVIEQPLPSQGLIVLMALNILRQFDLAALGQGSAETTHLQIEALRLAVDDRLRHAGDSRRVDVPLDWLLSDEHARQQAASIDLRRASLPRAPAPAHPDTTYLCAADADGTLVSYIHSLYAGCGVMLGDTGVLLNDRMNGFDLDEGNPNCLAPGKRPVHTLNQYMAQRDGQTVLVGGTPGAHWQVQTNLQLLVNVIDFGMDP